MRKASSDGATSKKGTPKFHATISAKKRARNPSAGQSAHETEAAQSLQRTLLAWYAAARRDLPWRKTRDPYAIWLSEVMLQQTRVETVIPYYARFLDRFPTVSDLADAPVGDVLALWSGLGYYRRARMLHAAAQDVAESGGALPASAEGLRAIKGIGRYTAGAIASIAYGEAAALVDGNVARVFARLFAIEDDVKSARGLARIWEIAESLVAREDPGAWNQALMELGATICVPRDPRCLVCPARDLCAARARGIERELPVVKAKAKARVQKKWAIVAMKDDRVLVGKRRAELRFGGLWEPPSIDALDGEEQREAVARLATEMGARFTSVERAGDVVHVLSHRRLEVAVLKATIARAPEKTLAGSEYEAMELVNVGDLRDRGVSTFARKVLAAAIG